MLGFAARMRRMQTGALRLGYNRNQEMKRLEPVLELPKQPAGAGAEEKACRLVLHPVPNHAQNSFITRTKCVDP
jgi:hypothetical protein